MEKSEIRKMRNDLLIQLLELQKAGKLDDATIITKVELANEELLKAWSSQYKQKITGRASIPGVKKPKISTAMAPKKPSVGKI